MLYKVTKSIVAYMVREGACTQEKAEIAEYGLYDIISNIIQVSVLSVVAVVFRVILAMLAFVLFYVPVRRFGGGAHAKTHLGCLCLYTSLALSGSLLGTYFSRAYVRPASILLMAFAVLVVFLRAPVTHENAPKKEPDIQRFRKKARRAVLAELAVVVLASAIPNAACLDTYIISAGLGSAFVVITLLIPSRADVGKEEVK